MQVCEEIMKKLWREVKTAFLPGGASGAIPNKKSVFRPGDGL
jgi:hypothetical protein